MDQFIIMFQDAGTGRLQAILDEDRKAIRVLSQDEMVAMSLMLTTKYQVVKLSFTNNP